MWVFIEVHTAAVDDQRVFAGATVYATVSGVIVQTVVAGRAVAVAAHAVHAGAGFEVLGYTSQGHFLVNCGLLSKMEQLPLGPRAMATKLRSGWVIARALKKIK